MNEHTIHNKLLKLCLSSEDEGVAHLARLELQTRYPIYRCIPMREVYENWES